MVGRGAAEGSRGPRADLPGRVGERRRDGGEELVGDSEDTQGLQTSGPHQDVGIITSVSRNSGSAGRTSASSRGQPLLGGAT
ncbi:hypothetical protein ABZZ80_41660 [Streptomyces sp. NPDC006356]